MEARIRVGLSLDRDRFGAITADREAVRGFASMMILVHRGFPSSAPSGSSRHLDGQYLDAWQPADRLSGFRCTGCGLGVQQCVREPAAIFFKVVG
jgi:hypothetical protein